MEEVAIQKPVATYTILAIDPDSDSLGIAVASRFLAVGSIVPYLCVGVAAIATQSIAHPALAKGILDDLKQDKGDPEAVLMRALEEDPDKDLRQIGILTVDGISAVCSGPSCIPYAGSVVATDHLCIGNTLAGKDVLDTMSNAFQRTEGDLADRLLSGLSAAEDVGGDARGKQAAALLVHRPGAGYRGSGDVLVDLRIDNDDDPIRCLRQNLMLLRKRWETD